MARNENLHRNTARITISTTPKSRRTDKLDRIASKLKRQRRMLLVARRRSCG